MAPFWCDGFLPSRLNRYTSLTTAGMPSHRRVLDWHRILSNWGFKCRKTFVGGAPIVFCPQPNPSPTLWAYCTTVFPAPTKERPKHPPHGSQQENNTANSKATDNKKLTTRPQAAANSPTPARNQPPTTPNTPHTPTTPQSRRPTPRTPPNSTVTQSPTPPQHPAPIHPQPHLKHTPPTRRTPHHPPTPRLTR